MDDVFRPGKIIWARFFITLLFILTVQTIQQYLSYVYYDRVCNCWSKPLDNIFVRFAIREACVYFNILCAFSQLKKMRKGEFISNIFLYISIGFDLLFILIAGIRYFNPTDYRLGQKYTEVVSYLNSGSLFVFCFALYFLTNKIQKNN